MTTQGFEVIVGVPNAIDNERVAIATASKYLARCDTTNTFGQRADVFDVNMYGGPTSEQDYGIGLCFAVPIPSDHGLKRFMDKMTEIAHVESVERVHYEVME